MICNFRHKQNMFFKRDILCKTGIVTKLTKNLVIIVTSLRSRCYTKNIMGDRGDHPHRNKPPPPRFAYVCILKEPLAPNNKRNN